MAEFLLLVTDVDRTLLTHDYRLPDRVVKALAAAREAGVTVALATARSPLAVQPYARRLGVTDLAICFNGGWIGDVETGVAIEEHPVPRVQAIEVMTAAQVLGLDAMWFSSGLIHALRDSEAVRKEAAVTGEPLVFIERANDLPGAPGKIMCVAAPGEAEQRFAPLRERFRDKLTVARSHPRLLEIGPRGMSKRRAIESVAARLGLSPVDCAAAGDAENDLDMLAWAGTAVTVDNAIDEAKAIAAFVGPSCDEGGLADGVAWLLARHGRVAA